MFDCGGLEWRDAQGPESIQDYGNVDCLLQQRALHRGEIAESGCDHAEDRKTYPRDNTLDRDPPRSPRDLDPRSEPVDPVDKQHDIGRLGGGCCATRAHGNTDISGRQRGRVVHAVAHHHDRPALALGQHEQNFLIRGQVGPKPIETEPLGHALRHVRAVAGGEQDALNSLATEPVELHAADRT